MLTRPALMQIGWFARGYDTVMPWQEALTARVRASWVWRVGRVWKERAKRVLAAAARRWKPTVLALQPVLAAAAMKLRIYATLLMREIRRRWAMLRSSS
jgi:hypothetical protein